MAATLPDFKTGDTYILTCTYAVDGNAVDLTSYTIRSQIRTRRNVLLSDLTITKDPDQVTNIGNFVVSATAAETANWVEGYHEVDIELAVGGVVKSTETIIQRVLGDVTK